MSKLGGGLQTSGGYRVHAQRNGACASFSYMDGLPANLHAASIEARSYSDLGPASAATAVSTDADQRKVAPAALGGGNSNDVLQQRDPLDVVFYQQYNNHYGVIEGRAISAVGAADVGSWSMRILDPEVKRRGRLASYRAISFEGKLKSSLRKRFKWFKDKCSSMLAGAAAGCPHHPNDAGDDADTR